MTVLHWIPVFTRPETVNILLDSLRFLSKDGLQVYAWVVLENHCHLFFKAGRWIEILRGLNHGRRRD